jgi:hypothetical protein
MISQSLHSDNLFSSLSNIELRWLKPIYECHVLFEDLWSKAPGGSGRWRCTLVRLLIPSPMLSQFPIMPPPAWSSTTPTFVVLYGDLTQGLTNDHSAYIFGLEVSLSAEYNRMEPNKTLCWTFGNMYSHIGNPTFVCDSFFDAYLQSSTSHSNRMCSRSCS